MHVHVWLQEFGAAFMYRCICSAMDEACVVGLSLITVLSIEQLHVTSQTLHNHFRVAKEVSRVSSFTPSLKRKIAEQSMYKCTASKGRKLKSGMKLRVTLSVMHSTK